MSNKYSDLLRKVMREQGNERAHLMGDFLQRELNEGEPAPPRPHSSPLDDQRLAIAKMIQEMQRLRDQQAKKADEAGYSGKAARLRQGAHDLGQAALRVLRKHDQ